MANFLRTSTQIVDIQRKFQVFFVVSETSNLDVTLSLHMNQKSPASFKFQISKYRDLRYYLLPSRWWSWWRFVFHVRMIFLYNEACWWILEIRHYDTSDDSSSTIFDLSALRVVAKDTVPFIKKISFGRHKILEPMNSIASLSCWGLSPGRPDGKERPPGVVLSPLSKLDKEQPICLLLWALL